MLKKIADYFKVSVNSEINVPVEGLNSLYKSSLTNIFICCVLLFMFSTYLDLGYSVYSCNMIFNFLFVFGSVVVGIIADKFDTKKITKVSFFLDGIAILLFLLSSFFKNSFIFSVLETWFGFSIVIKACSFVKTLAYWTSKKERAFVVAFIIGSAYLLFRIFSEISSLLLHNDVIYLTLFAFVCISLGYFFSEKMVNTPATLGLPSIEEYRNLKNSKYSEIPEISENSYDYNPLLLKEEIKKNVLKNKIFQKLLLVLVILNMFPPYTVGRNAFSSTQDFWVFWIFLILAFLSNKLFKSKRVPIVQNTLVALLYFQLALLVLPLSKSIIYSAHNVIFAVLVAIKAFLIYVCVIEIGKKCYAATRFGICSTLCAGSPFIMPCLFFPLIYCIIPNFSRIDEWILIIINFVAILVLEPLRKNNI